MKKIFNFRFLVCAVLVTAIVCHEIYTYNIYKNSDSARGVVIDKTYEIGRKSTYYLYIKWEGYGLRSMTVHPITYKRTGVGDAVVRDYSYTPIFGIRGGGNVPLNGLPENNPFGFFIGLFKLAIIAFMSLFIYSRD